RPICAQRAEGNVPLPRADRAGPAANPGTGGESSARLLRAPTLVFGPGGRARTQGDGGCPLAETPLFPGVTTDQRGGAKHGATGRRGLPGAFRSLRLYYGQ